MDNSYSEYNDSNLQEILKCYFLYICESQNWPVGPGGEISLLGVAAHLSSRKTGYLLRVAPMIQIIFFRRNGSRRPTAGLHSLALLASLFCYTHGNNYIFANKKSQRSNNDKSKQY